MVTISADVTPRMKKWVEMQVKRGIYKSSSEVVRDAIRDCMEKEYYEKIDYKKLFSNKKALRAFKQIEHFMKKNMI